MATYYAKRGLEILEEEGAIEMVKRSVRVLPQMGRIRVGGLHLINSVRYDAVANPYEPIWVDPSDLELRHGTAREIDRQSTLGLIRGGGWDEEPDLFDTQWIYKGLKQRYNQNKPWEDTIYVQKGVNRDWGFETIDEFIKKRCAFVDEMYHSMKEDGYKYNPNRQITYDKDGLKSLQALQKLEPLVVISRNGEFILRDGMHRVSISKILELEKIPVHVLCRHNQWQKLRDEIHNNGLPEKHEDLRDHPDLRDVLD